MIWKIQTTFPPAEEGWSKHEIETCITEDNADVAAAITESWAEWAWANAEGRYWMPRASRLVFCARSHAGNVYRVPLSIDYEPSFTAGDVVEVIHANP